MSRHSHNRASSAASYKRSRRIQLVRPMSILTTAPIHTKIELQVPLLLYYYTFYYYTIIFLNGHLLDAGCPSIQQTNLSACN